MALDAHRAPNDRAPGFAPSRSLGLPPLALNPSVEESPFVLAILVSYRRDIVGAMPITYDLTGQRFGRLVAVEPRGAKPRKWFCRCDCGGSTVTETNNLRSGNSMSCGCKAREAVAKRRTTHGHTRGGKYHPLYATWVNMRARCTRPSHQDFKNYGWRGIKVCDRWMNSFENFLADMGERPPGMTIDRINNDGNYEPGNVRWATRKEQSANRRHVVPWKRKERPRVAQ